MYYGDWSEWVEGECQKFDFLTGAAIRIQDHRDGGCLSWDDDMGASDLKMICGENQERLVLQGNDYKRCLLNYII